MAHKVIDVTRYRDHYDELSQTPKNFDKDNYFLKELQDKVDADWRFRPNRVDIEYEAVKATMEQATHIHYGDDASTWKPIQVVVQSVRSEKGTAISNDCRRVVFRNILEDRFNLGSKFRFYPRFASEEDNDALKNVWLVTNLNQINMTSSVVIERCNGTLISAYVDEQNMTHYHSEPVIQGMNLSSTSMFYNDTAVLPQSELLIVAQHNDFTRQYYINQRIVIGYDRVYRIKALNKFYSNSTNNPYDVGLIHIYMELVEISPYDDLEKRIAFQENDAQVIPEIIGDKEYRIIFKEPQHIPDILPSTAVVFKPMVVDKEGTEYPNIPISVDWSLTRLPDPNKKDIYVDYDTGTEDNVMWFSLSRKKLYLNGPLHVECTVNSNDDPNKQGFGISIDIGMN